MLIVTNGAFKNGSTWLNKIAMLVVTPRRIPKRFQDPKLMHQSVEPRRFERFLDETDVASVDYVSTNHVRDRNVRETLLSHEHVRVLNITRDLRDVLVSAYFHDRRNGLVEGDIGGYWRGLGRRRIVGVIEHHRLWNTGHSQVFVMSYEALHTSFSAQVHALAAFLGVDEVDVDAIRTETDFDRLRSRSQSAEAFHRKGIVGDWQNHLSTEILTELEQLATESPEPRLASDDRSLRALRRTDRTLGRLLRTLEDEGTRRPNTEKQIRLARKQLYKNRNMLGTEPTNASISDAAQRGSARSPDAPINAFPAGKRVSSFATLLAAYREAKIPLYDAIDGGAGVGTISKQMLPYLTGVVFAFEPFPGNHRFFENGDPRIILRPHALAETQKEMAFHVASVVTAESALGKRGRAGYSATGKLVADGQDGDLRVQCVPADAEIPQEREISVIKLDLQGGELNALKGMTKLLGNVALMWVEFTGQDGLIDYLTEQGFVIFETEYLFRGDPDEKAQELFEVSDKDVTLTTGKTAWHGFKRTMWKSFEAEFQQYRRDLSLVQTDLVCVNRARFGEFQRAVRAL